jgi:hypothetical protein
VLLLGAAAVAGVAAVVAASILLSKVEELNDFCSF